MPEPTIVTIPCFSGAPWELSSLTPLAHRPLRTMRLPDGVVDIERSADFVEDQIRDLDDVVLAGDSFGAVVALALATRRPRGLRALVLSGGFAANPVDSPVIRAKMAAARFRWSRPETSRALAVILQPRGRSSVGRAPDF